MVAYALLVWPVLYGVGTRYVSPPPLGMAIAGFIWLLGFWFLPPRAKNERFTFLAWLGISLIYAVALFAIRWLIEKLFEAT